MLNKSIKLSITLHFCLAIILTTCDSLPTSKNSDFQNTQNQKSASVASQSNEVIEENVEVINLGHLGGNYSIALDINEREQVVGLSTTKEGEIHAFLWEKGKMYDLGALKEGHTSRATAINNKGQIVGWSGTTSGSVEHYGILWNKDKMIDIGNLGSPYTIAYDINDKGQITGRSSETFSPSHAFIWDKGKMTDLDILDGNYTSQGRAMNNRGQIVGSLHKEQESIAFLWERGSMTNIGSLDKSLNFAIATSINNQGKVVGYSSISAPSKLGYEFHAFVFYKNRIRDLGTLISNNRGGSVANDINDKGQVVGYSNTSSGANHAFLWAKGEMYDLGVLDGYTSSIGYAINNKGYTVGYSSTSTGVRHATLWKTPKNNIAKTKHTLSGSE